MFHCVQVSKSIVEDVVGKDREDATAKSKAETNKAPSKSAVAEELVKVNTSQALLSLCTNIITLLTLYHYIICLSGCII